MEFFGDLFEFLLIIILIVVGICAVAFPIMFDIEFHDPDDGYPLCHGFAVLQFIGIAWSAVQISEDKAGGAVLAVLVTIIVHIIAMIRAYNRNKALGHRSSICAAAVLAQMLLPISIFIVLFIISMIIDDVKKKFEKK